MRAVLSRHSTGGVKFLLGKRLRRGGSSHGFGAILAAQADAAGEWYYGTVRQEDVEKLFESAAKAGVATLK